MPARYRFHFAMCLGMAVAAGCGKSAPPRTAVQPVTGKLFVNDRPAPEARVYFHAKGLIDGRDIHPMAIVTEDGQFQPTTYESSDGLPTGEYAVTVSWPTFKTDAGEKIEGPDRFQGDFARRDHPVAQITVHEGTNELAPIRLTHR